VKNTLTFQNNNDDDDNDNCDDAASKVLGKVTQSYLKTFNLHVPYFEKISVVSVFILELKVTTNVNTYTQQHEIKAHKFIFHNTSVLEFQLPAHIRIYVTQLLYFPDLLSIVSLQAGFSCIRSR